MASMAARMMGRRSGEKDKKNYSAEPGEREWREM
jgi:hypothetical protein